MSDRTTRKLIILPTLVIPRENRSIKIWWWKKMHPLELLQLPVIFLIVLTSISAITLQGVLLWRSAFSMWCLCIYFLMVLFILDYKLKQLFKQK